MTGHRHRTNLDRNRTSGSRSIKALGIKLEKTGQESVAHAHERVP